MSSNEEQSTSSVYVELIEKYEDGLQNRAVRSYEIEEDFLYLDTVLSVFEQALTDLGFVTDGKQLVLRNIS